MSTDTQEQVVIERIYKARLDDVWELWTTKAGFESWWGPRGFRVEVQELDARVGGTLRYEMIADSAEMIAAMKQAGQPPSHGTRGKFAEFEPQKRLKLVHVIDFIPGVESYEHTIECDFHVSGEHVRMVVTAHPHRDPHWTKMSVEGFRSQLTKLDSRFAPRDYDIVTAPVFAALEKVSIPSVKKLSDHHWFNRTLCQVNDSLVRIGVFQGEFHWHSHEKEDEFFLVLEGHLDIEIEGRATAALDVGEGILVPKGVRHRPIAKSGATVLMVEQATIVPTGS